VIMHTLVVPGDPFQGLGWSFAATLVPLALGMIFIFLTMRK